MTAPHMSQLAADTVAAAPSGIPNAATTQDYASTSQSAGAATGKHSLSAGTLTVCSSGDTPNGASGQHSAATPARTSSLGSKQTRSDTSQQLRQQPPLPRKPPRQRDLQTQAPLLRLEPKHAEAAHAPAPQGNRQPSNSKRAPGSSLHMLSTVASTAKQIPQPGRLASGALRSVDAQRTVITFPPVRRVRAPLHRTASLQVRRPPPQCSAAAPPHLPSIAQRR